MLSPVGGHSISDSFCPPATLSPSVNIQTINFSQTRRGPWESRASVRAHAEGLARQPEDLRGRKGTE